MQSVPRDGVYMPSARHMSGSLKCRRGARGRMLVHVKVRGGELCQKADVFIGFWLGLGRLVTRHNRGNVLLASLTFLPH